MSEEPICRYCNDTGFCTCERGREILAEFSKLRAEQGEDDGLKQAVKAVVGIIMDSVVETIGVDGHQWSDRPCQTCRAVSALIGRPYGCYWYQSQ